MDSLQAGQMLGPYRILNQVGKGGMATVYRAYHAAMDRYVAIKILPRQLAESPEFVGRFQQEAHTIARLEHAHILPVYDFGQDGEHTYLVMRYLQAGTLADRLTSGGLPLAEVDRILTQLATALQYAHARGVIHRDLKPSNVLVDASGNVYLTDFGIAKLLEADTRFTGTGVMIGTPAYMSPEQAQGLPVDQRSDIYALGIILYEMVTGRVPFEADTPVAVIYQHVNAPLPPPSSIKPGLARGVEKVLLKALAKDRAHRYASTGDLLDAWRAALAEVPGLTHGGRPPAPALTEVVPSGSSASAAPTQVGAPRRGLGWLGVFGGLGALGAAACVGVACLALAAMQGLAAFNRGADRGPTPSATEVAGAVETLVGDGTDELETVSLETGLPRAVTYGGLVHTVTGAVLESEPRPDDFLTLLDNVWVARLAVRVENTTTQYTFLGPEVYRLRLSDGQLYPAQPRDTVAPEAGAAEGGELLFVVPAGAAWDGAQLEIGAAGYEPAVLPLTGEAPLVAYPRALPLPAPSQVTPADQQLRYEFLSAALDLDWDIQRAEIGQRFLKLELRLTNLGGLSGLAVGPESFRLLVDGVPQAPTSATIEVIDYQSAKEFEVVFAVPADAGAATLQLGNVTAADAELITLALALSGE